MLVYSNSRQKNNGWIQNKTAGQRICSDRWLGDKNIAYNVKNKGVVHHFLFFTSNNPIRIIVAGTDVHGFLCTNSYAALPLLTCRGLIELQGMDSDIGLSLLTRSTHFRLSVAEPFLFVTTVIVGLCVYVCVWYKYILLCAAFCLIVPAECTCIHGYLVCWHQIDQHGIQQLLWYSVSLADDGAHQVHHMHVHLLVVAVARETRQEGSKGQRRHHRITQNIIFHTGSFWDSNF